MFQVIGTQAGKLGHDAAGNLAWSAAGLPADTPCSTTGNAPGILARKTVRTYDARNRLVGLDFPDGNGDQAWTYTPDGLPEQVVTWNDNGGSWTTNAYAYNKRRMLTGESQAENDRDASWTWAIGYGYNANGHLATQAYPTHYIVDFAPNALGQATQAIGASATFATGASYYPNGALKQFTYGNGIVHTLIQNDRGLPDRSVDALGTTHLLDDGYDYDQNGNVAAISDGAAGQALRGNRTMAYDGLDRLTAVASPMWGGGAASYTYDALDNLTRVAVPATLAAPARDHTYHYTDNRLSSVTNTVGGATVIGLGYDLQGNVDNKNGTLYSFDFGNRLRSAAGNSYRYDAHGRRVKTSSAAGDVYFVYGQSGQLYWTRDQRDQQRRRFIYLGGSLIAEHTRPIGATTETVTYQHTDALGSPVARTNQAGQVIERSEYEPYGKLANRANDDKPGYTGHVMDAGTGLVQMQQRYYDPGIGMFLSVDPVMAYSNPVGQFHRYRYANNNPYKFTDPDGRRSTLGCGGALCDEYREISQRCARTCVAEGADQQQSSKPNKDSGWPNGEFSGANWEKRKAAANYAVGYVRAQVSEIPHKSKDSAAKTFLTVFQPISSRFGVEIDGAIEGFSNFYITGIAVGDRARLTSAGYIGYTVDGGFGDTTTTIHAHPVVFSGAPGYSPFSPQDLNWYGASNASHHYVSDPSGLFRYDGPGVAPVRIDE